MKTYTVEDIRQAGYTLEPMECVHCGSNAVIYNQAIGDASCEECGEWQTDGEDND